MQSLWVAQSYGSTQSPPGTKEKSRPGRASQGDSPIELVNKNSPHTMEMAKEDLRAAFQTEGD